ncbi:MAG: arylsulfatase [Kordiimonadaceae bacterium]|jgi:arylsulfatase A-like enzyme|nr:arylsulfatase [Kordiimonadaceae bacterium]MBT6035879.1 arylsulfatase [Kordiimonadaceae bacterium]MBT6330912.1 arylsulfatase [Kordiimonadaceae bacterium]MBT7581617.1 arylsulfatase [Kordiimonadaceae bacterium]
MKNILRFITILPLMFACAQEQKKQDERPNILLIMADDMGYSDIASFGSEISTPNLDKLASGGLKMSNFHAGPACSITRTMLLSGADSHRSGMGTMYNDQVVNQLGQPGYEGYMNEDVVSVSTLLQDVGYNTYMTGKWHLGYNEEQSPKARGFDQSFVLLQGGSGHFDDRTLMVDFEKSWFMDNGKRTDWPSGYFSSEFYTDKMIDYMKMGEADDKPFFGYLAYTAPHWPLQAPADYLDKYAGQYDDGYAALTDARLKSMQDLGMIKSGIKTLPPIYPEQDNWENLSEEQKKIKSREMEIYASMVDNMDFHIGRVLDYLEKSGQRENTIIIFMSDNGAAGAGPGQARAFPKEWIEANFDNSYDNMGKINSYIYYGPHWAQASSAPSRLFKGFPTQGGIKVPAIINFPGKIGGREDQFSNEFMTILDLAPTFLELAETKHPGTNYNGRAIFPHIGTSAVSFLNGSLEQLHDENDTVAWELNSRAGVRKGDWKIVKIPGRFGTGEWELFNMVDDPGETNDLSAQNTVKLVELIAAWDKYVIDNGVIMAAE